MSQINKSDLDYTTKPHCVILTLMCSLYWAIELMDRSQHIHFPLRDKVPNGSVIAKGKLLLHAELFPS